MDNLNLIDNDIKLNNNSISIDDIIDEQLDIENTVLPGQLIVHGQTSFLAFSPGHQWSSWAECTALVELKPHGLLVAQTMFRKSIKISIKSFLISLSLGFLNLFF